VTVISNCCRVLKYFKHSYYILSISLPTHTVVAGLGFSAVLVCASVGLSVVPCDISKTAADSITKLHLEMSHHDFWKLVYFVFKRSLSHDMGFCSLGRVPHNQPRRLVVWHSGRMSICDRRIFPVLRSTCSWWVTTYVGKSSATRSANWANSAFQPFEVDKWVVSCNRMCTTSLRWRNLVNAYGVKAGWFIQFADKRVGGR